jgi:cation diffusion facilitator family transporter
VRVAQAQNLASGSIVLGLVVLSLKAAAWWITGSAGLFSDAAETVVNVAASVITLLAVRLAAQPADANHPYGHDKAEFFAAIIEGVLIVVASVLIGVEAWESFRAPKPLESLPLGLGLNAISTVFNFVWSLLLMRRGRVLRSTSLRADGQHLMADVVTSLAVLTGVALVFLTGKVWLDPLVAALAALYVFWSGVRVIRESASGLMDAAPPPEVIERIRRIVSEQAEGAIEAHDLRTRHAGRLTFMEFHLVLPGAMTVDKAHEICDRIEAALKAEIEGLMVTIHVEPEGKAKHHGVLVL